MCTKLVIDKKVINIYFYSEHGETESYAGVKAEENVSTSNF